MLGAGLFASALILGFILLDWWYFGRPERQAMAYGCQIGTMTFETDELPGGSLSAHFGPTKVLPLPHGYALWFPEGERILLKPDCRRFASRFRTAWPLKGSVEIQRTGSRTSVVCAKRIPWSSATATLLWFLLVGGGTLGFLISFAREGGLSSLGSMLLGFGVAAFGLLVLVFGLVTVALAYRIENGRLVQVWEEWRMVVAGGRPTEAVRR